MLSRMSARTTRPARVSRPAHPRNAGQRRAAILQETQQRGHVAVADLSRRLGVSEVSIRRDLEYLHDKGLLRRTHGGAEALPLPARGLMPFDARLLQRAEVKQAIGRRAAGLIQRGEVVLIDSGTTALAVARQLGSVLPEGGLTVVTRSLSIAAELRYRRHARLIVLGGVYQPEFDTFVGDSVEAALRALHAHRLFIGTDGVTLERGLTTDNVLEAGLFRVMAERADQVIVVADSSKIGVDQLQAVLPLSRVNTFVTDRDAPARFVTALRERGIEVLLAA